MDYPSHDTFMQQPGCWSIESSLMASPASSFKGGSMLHAGSKLARGQLPSSFHAVDESLDSHIKQLACWSIESSLMASPVVNSTAGHAQLASPILHAAPPRSIVDY